MTYSDVRRGARLAAGLYHQGLRTCVSLLRRAAKAHRTLPIGAVSQGGVRFAPISPLGLLPWPLNLIASRLSLQYGNQFPYKVLAKRSVLP